MNNIVRMISIVVAVTIIMVNSAAAQEVSVPTQDTTAVAADNPTATARELTLIDSTILIPRLDYNGTSLADALTALGRAYNLSLYVDQSVTGTITLRLDNVTLNDALLFILKEHQLAWERTGQIIKIFKPVPPPPPAPQVNIAIENGLLSLDVTAVPVERFASKLIDLTGKNIVVELGVQGSVSGKISKLSLEKMLAAILPPNGLMAMNVDGVYYIAADTTTKVGKVRSRNLAVSCSNGLVTVDIDNMALSEAINAIGAECGTSIIKQAQLDGTISAHLTACPIEQAMTTLLINSAYTFKRVGSAYIVGNRDSEQLYESQLVQLKHLVASTVEPMIPAMLTKQVTVKVVKEHNGLLFNGPRTAIAQIEAFLDEVDIPIAQVLFEVLVVDYNITDGSTFNLTANNFGGKTSIPGYTYYPDIDINRTGDQLNRDLRDLSRELGIRNLGTLPSDFFARLRWMVDKGIANIRSQPKIASLNGHPASIKIGTTQYFLLKSETTYPENQSSTTRTSERFEQIEADMSLEVTPFVNREGELIVEIKPEFNSPVGSFDPEVPPTINRRQLSSTVRLHNGETIVLGGLVEQTKNSTIEKLPILGSLPLIGRIFQNHTSTERQSDLMIYITPRVYFGTEGSVDLDSLLRQK